LAKLPALPIIRADVTQGLSANASYRKFQAEAAEGGLQGLRRQDYLRLYSETLNARGRVAAAVSAPKDLIPGRENITQRSKAGRQGYGTWVMVYQRTKGETDLIAQPWLLRSDELMTPQEAERQVGSYIANNPYEYDRVLIGIGYAGTDAYQPYSP
jgi:hypothetical protein